MKRLILVASMLTLAAGCSTNQGRISYGAHENQMTPGMGYGYATTSGPKGKEAATMTAPILTDAYGASGHFVTTSVNHGYATTDGPKGKEAALMTAPITTEAPAYTFTGAPANAVITETGQATSVGPKGKQAAEMTLPVLPQ